MLVGTQKGKIMERNTGILRGLLLVAACFAIAVSPARADVISLTLNPADRTAAPGDVLTFDATVYAPDTNGARVFMQGDSPNVDDPLIIDDFGFWNNLPGWLDPGQSWEGTLFTVTVPLDADGFYTGNFEIDGISDGQQYGPLGNSAFNVEVDASPVPEPSTLVLIGTVLLMMARLKRSAARVSVSNVTPSNNGPII